MSDEVCKEMKPEDQRRLQLSTSKGSTLTIEALEAHDIKERAGPCQLRQFGCPLCMHSWWHNVLRSKPVSRCKGGVCGNLRYDALPRCKEFGIGRFLCPNPHCGRRFFGYCEATDILRCRKCGTPSMPYIHPKWRKSRPQSLNPKARSFYPIARYEKEDSIPDIGQLNIDNDLLPHKPLLPNPPALIPPSSSDEDASEDSVSESGVSEVDSTEADIDDAEAGGDAISQASSDWLMPSTRSTATLSDSDDDSSIAQCSSYSSVLQRGLKDKKTPSTVYTEIKSQPYKRRIFNASKVHEPIGGTISTFLTQMDFQITGKDVILDYDGDVDDDKVGACKFECAKCENDYMVICRMQDTAECFNCHTSNSPLNWAPPRGALVQSGTNCKHSCSRCESKGHCPNLLA